jgi:TP901 family phage tail tape measure protein
MAKKKKVTYWFGADITEFERKVKNLDRRLYRLSDSIGKYGMAFTKSLTAPLTAMGMIATKAALNVEKALSDIARGTGASGAALKGLEKDWKALAGKVDDSFETSAKVLADYNTRLGLTGTALQEISKQALDAAGMLGEEVNSVVMESAKAMQDWGVASSEMAGYMDKIFVASQQTGVSMAGLATNMYKYGSALRQMGFDADAAIATLAQFDKQGVNTELVMGSLRIALGKMAKAGITDASEAFKVLTDQIKNAKTPTEGTRLAIELFGSRAGPDMAAAIREGRFELGNLTEALNTSRGAIEKADAATETFVERWGEVKNQVQIAIEPIGKAILKVAVSCGRGRIEIDRCRTACNWKRDFCFAVFR